MKDKKIWILLFLIVLLVASNLFLMDKVCSYNEIVTDQYVIDSLKREIYHVKKVEDVYISHTYELSRIYRRVLESSCENEVKFLVLSIKDYTEILTGQYTADRYWLERALDSMQVIVNQ